MDKFDQPHLISRKLVIQQRVDPAMTIAELLGIVLVLLEQDKSLEYCRVVLVSAL